MLKNLYVKNSKWFKMIKMLTVISLGGSNKIIWFSFPCVLLYIWFQTVILGAYISFLMRKEQLKKEKQYICVYMFMYIITSTYTAYQNSRHKSGFYIKNIIYLVVILLFIKKQTLKNWYLDM